MTALGDILQLLHDAAELARPARLTVVEWNHASRGAAAFDRYMIERHVGRGTAVTARFVSESESPEETRRTTSLAFESPTRFREEAAGRQAGVRYTVRDGINVARYVAKRLSYGPSEYQSLMREAMLKVLGEGAMRYAE